MNWRVNVKRKGNTDLSDPCHPEPTHADALLSFYFSITERLRITTLAFPLQIHQEYFALACSSVIRERFTNYKTYSPLPELSVSTDTISGTYR